MDYIILAVIGLFVLFALLFLRMPVSFAMFLIGFIGVVAVVSLDAGFNILAADVWYQFTSYSYSVIPLFILMGEIIYRSGMADKLFEAAYKWIGHFRGGMASTTILTSAGFSAVNGSNSATAATMATIALPELSKYNYSKSLSAGSVATGGTLGIIFPPSAVLIIIALQMQLSIRDLFLAIIVPGILLTILLIANIIYITFKDPTHGPAGARHSVKERLISLKGVLPIAILFVFVLGGLFMGFFTPTESGAFGVFGAVVIALVTRRLTFRKFQIAISSSLKTTAMVLMLVVGAIVFGRFLTVTGLPNALAGWVEQLAFPSIVILLMILFVYLIGGAIMDALGFLVVSIPVFFPTVVALGYDPLWFAVILCVVTSMGAITPPVGVNAFIVQGLAQNTPITTVFRGTISFIIVYIIFIGLLILFPQIVLFSI
ncbi:TRAP transporter large permease [Salicibibacter cibarius]|uniref:TRAP transporter large permease n=1 Tax=Salicibibacter cibarius TaxID=2743000 RepID=A0A7T7CA02_9BACI|nr:TRAP transporter large permease [Salicibibacter cibarius]QQK74384.1 TRAP transporter large permease [Salicibibacter cibarius]